MSTQIVTQNNQLAIIDEALLNDFRRKMESFTSQLNAEPTTEELERTPDGRAQYLPISFVENTLDELFMGRWETTNFRWERILNEIIGSIDLVVIHPFTQEKIVRTGAAAYQIMVDAYPSNLPKDEKNKWALNLENKKPNSLDMGFPKLKADCIKNAALSLGKIFGRDINRKKTDSYSPLSLPTEDDLADLYHAKQHHLDEKTRANIERVINNKEVNNYKKLRDYLNKLP